MSSKPHQSRKQSNTQVDREQIPSAHSQPAPVGPLSSVYQGPIPSSSEMAMYEGVLPGSASRIIAMAEQEQRHRHHMEQARLSAEVEIIKATSSQTRRGQWMALLCTILFASLAGYSIYRGFQVLGGVLATGDIAWVVYLFIKASNATSPKK